MTCDTGGWLQGAGFVVLRPREPAPVVAKQTRPSSYRVILFVVPFFLSYFNGQLRLLLPSGDRQAPWILTPDDQMGQAHCWIRRGGSLITFRKLMRLEEAENLWEYE